MGISWSSSPAGTASWSPLHPGAFALHSARLTVTGDSPSDDIRLTVTGDSPSDDIRVAFCSWIPLARSAVSYLEINV